MQMHLLAKVLALKNLGKFEQSLEICKKAIDIRPDFGICSSAYNCNVDL